MLLHETEKKEDVESGWGGIEVREGERGRWGKVGGEGGKEMERRGGGRRQWEEERER